MSVDLSEAQVSLVLDAHGTSASVATPPWASWLLWLGQWMRVQASLDGRRVAVVRSACRRTNAAFVTLGCLLASAQAHDDSLDWQALKSLPKGTKVFWQESSSGGQIRQSGHVVGEVAVGGQEFMVVSIEGRGNRRAATRSFARKAALGYGITLGAVSASAGERLSRADRVMQSAVQGCSAAWIRSPRTDCVVVTELGSFLSDLPGLTVSSADGAFTAPFVDMLALGDPQRGTHGKTRLVFSRRDGLLDGDARVAILDGPSAVRRLGDTNAASVIAILDRAEYDEEIEHSLAPFMASASDSAVHVPAQGLRQPPSSIEVAVFGLYVSTPVGDSTAAV